MKKKLIAVAIASVVVSAFVSTPVRADELSDLKAQIESLSKRFAELENKQAQAPAAAPAVHSAKPVLAMTTDQEGVTMNPDDSAIIQYGNGTSSLKVYGLIEGTLSNVDHQTQNGGRTTGYQTAWFSGNRLGFDAQHALKFGESIGMPDLKAIMKIESEFELPTGGMDTAGNMWNRDAWVGFYADNLGKLTFGRQNTLTRDFTNNWGDPYGAAATTLKEGGYSNVNNFKQFIFYSGGPNGTRNNSAVEWKKRYGDHVVVGLGYTFGSGGNGGSSDPGTGGSTPGDQSKGTGQAASLAFNKIDLGPAVANFNVSYDRANITDLVHQSELIGGNLSFGALRFNAGFVHYTAKQGVNNSMGTRTDISWTTSVSYLLGQTDFALGYQQMKGNHVGSNGTGTNVRNPFFDTALVTQVTDGGKNTIYGSIMFHADKQLDVYLAADHFTTTGGWIVGDAQGNGMQYGAGQSYKGTTELVTGVRYKF